MTHHYPLLIEQDKHDVDALHVYIESEIHGLCHCGTLHRDAFIQALGDSMPECSPFYVTLRSHEDRPTVNPVRIGDCPA